VILEETMKESFLTYFKAYGRKIISLTELEKICPAPYSYEEFCEVIQSFVKTGILSDYGAKHGSYREGVLCPKYRINLSRLIRDDREKLQREMIQMQVSPLMDLSYYFKASWIEWKKDKPRLKKIADYLKLYGFPRDEVTEQERSYQIFGDEQVLLQGGMTLLEKLNLQDKMRIANCPDPLMVAINPAVLLKDAHRHLIVENKAVYYALLPILPETEFASLTFGGGWKIIGNLFVLPRQLGLVGQQHSFYYFGNLDLEGLAIWYGLQAKLPVQLAMPFYRELFNMDCSSGKVEQSVNCQALDAFCEAWDELDARRIRRMLLRDHTYYPQECLTKEQMVLCWHKLTVETQRDLFQ
jgi:hypothetical protein